MSAFPSAYIRDKVLDKVFKNTNFTSPASLFLALYTTNPTAADTGTEVSGGSYARQSVTFASASGGSSVSNLAANFASLPTAVITHWGIRDASTAGNLIAFGELPNPITANAGDSATVPSGAITISLSGS